MELPAHSTFALEISFFLFLDHTQPPPWALIRQRQTKFRLFSHNFGDSGQGEEEKARAKLGGGMRLQDLASVGCPRRPGQWGFRLTVKALAKQMGIRGRETEVWAY